MCTCIYNVYNYNNNIIEGNGIGLHHFLLYMYIIRFITCTYCIYGPLISLTLYIVHVLHVHVPKKAIHEFLSNGQNSENTCVHIQYMAIKSHYTVQ